MGTEFPAYENALKCFSEKKIIEAKKYADSIDIKSADEEVLLLLANIYSATNSFVQTESVLKKLIEYFPKNSEYILALALIYKNNGKSIDAENIYQKALEKFSDNYKVYYNYGILLYEKKEFIKAVASFIKATELNSNFALSYYNLANTYKELSNFKDAALNYEKAIRVEENFTNAHYNLGVVKEKEYKYNEAIKAYLKAIEIDPNFVDAHWNLSILYLLLGNYLEGWEEYEWRLKKEEFIRPDIKGKKWEGENLKNKKIYVYSEQGIGDLFQFVRYLQLLKEQGAFIILECKKRLHSLLSEVEYIDLLVEKKELASNYDYYSPILSLPKIFVKSNNNIFNKFPYLKVNSKLEKKWQEYFRDNNKFKIGIVWQGNPNHQNDKYRSAKFDFFIPFTKIENTEFYSLQYLKDTNVSPEILEKYSILNFDYDFDNIAAIIKNLDIVITVDTSIAHLAGALNKNTWLLLSHYSDWRWLLEKNYTNWYPSMKIFRMKPEESWKNLFKKVFVELLIIQNKAENWETLYNKGLESYQKNDIDGAINYIEQSLIINEKNSIAHNNLGLLYQMKGILEKALKHFRSAVDILPDYIEALNNLGILFYKKGEKQKGILLIEKAISINNTHADSYYNLALIHQTENNFLEAKKNYLCCIEYSPKYELAYYNYSFMLIKKNNLEEAEMILSKALNEGIDTYNINFIAGNLYKEKEDYNKSLFYYTKAIQLDNRNMEVYINLASVYYLMRNLENAETLYRNMLEQNFYDERIYFNLAVIKQEKLLLDEAEELFKKAIDRKPYDYNYHLGLAEIYLLQGNYNRGWKEYEWRLERNEYKNRKIKLPNNIEDIRGKRVLIFMEQGFGDVFNATPFLKKLKDFGAEIIFEVREGIKNLYRVQDFIDETVNFGEEVVADFRVPILSLFKYFVKSKEKKYYDYSFISIPEKKMNFWKSKLKHNKFKIGIVWQGKKYPVHNRKRHIEKKYFEELAEGIDAYFYSLQVGKDFYNLKNIIMNLCEDIEDFSDTAAIIKNLDLIITIDTSVAHLAGIIGKEVWTLLPFSPDWRWALEDSNTIWYPTMKLFRQEQIDNWDKVFDIIKIKLQEKIN